MAYNVSKKHNRPMMSVQIHSTSGHAASSDTIEEAHTWIDERLRERPNETYGIYVLDAVMRAKVDVKLEQYDKPE